MFIELLITSAFLMPSGRFIRQIDGFLEPSHAIWLPDGNIAVADRMADAIVIVSSAGERLQVFTEVNNPEHLQLDATGVATAGGVDERPTWSTTEIQSAGIGSKTSTGWIIPDKYGHSIHHYDLEGNWLGKWGVHALLPHAGEGKLHYPNAVSVSPDGKQIIVCEGFEGRIQIFDLAQGQPEAPPLVTNIAHFGKHVDSYGDLILVAEPELGDVYLLRTGLEVPIELTRFGGGGDAPHQFNWINGLWIGEGEIKVVGERNLKTFIFEHNPESPLRQIPSMVKFQKMQRHDRFQGAIDADGFGNICMAPNATDIAMTKDGSTMWTVDALHETVKSIRTIDHEVTREIKGFVEPQGIAIEQDGNILVSDIGASHIKRFSPEGNLLLTFGEKGFLPHQMYKPAGITVLENGTIVVIDWGNHRAQLYKPDGSWAATFGRGRSWTRE